MKSVLTIAGSDSSGGAGIQADIKTMTVHGVFAQSAITALTAQNTLGVYGVMEVDPEFLKQQIDCVFEDIRPDAVKIGMVSSAELVDVIAERLQYYEAINVVVDPVMVATSGAQLSSSDAAQAMIEKLVPLADIVTPNIPEAEELAGMKIANVKDMSHAARLIKQRGCRSVLIKGGHLENNATDVFLTEHERLVELTQRRVKTLNTHGTGCTLSSAIASNLALGNDLQAAVQKAKQYITGALKHDIGLGKGTGPLNHMWDITPEELF